MRSNPGICFYLSQLDYGERISRILLGARQFDSIRLAE